MIPEFLNTPTYTPDMYRKLMSEKAYTETRLEEALYINQIREETIQVLEDKLRKFGEIQSRMDARAYEVNSLQEFLGEEQKKASHSMQRETGWLEELSASVKTDQQFADLEKRCDHLERQVVLLTSEADEIAAINKELTREARKIAPLQSELENAMTENKFLQQKIAALEIKLKKIPAVFDV